MEFEWDPVKAASSLRKHGVSFEEARTAFGDPFADLFHDPNHSDDEERFLLVGRDSNDRLLIVCFADRHDRVRPISARPATRGERRAYEVG